MKFVIIVVVALFGRRAPQGARGLKCLPRDRPLRIDLSRPARGAWVEILTPKKRHKFDGQSRPARGAWVEISSCKFYRLSIVVAPRKGRVG